MVGYSSAVALRTYTSVSIETGVAAANPHRLIVMLFDGALLATARARQAIVANDYVGRGQSISKAIRIIEEGLKAALNDKGSDLTLNLRALYEYMGCKLLFASLKNDLSAVDEVTRLLAELKDAWNAIEPRQI